MTYDTLIIESEPTGDLDMQLYINDYIQGCIQVKLNKKDCQGTKEYVKELFLLGERVILEKMMLERKFNSIN